MEISAIHKVTDRDAIFYFANLGADVSRCVTAAREGNDERYNDSLDRAYSTLAQLRKTDRPEAYEEALLMLRGLALARRTPETLASFSLSLDALISLYFQGV